MKVNTTIILLLISAWSVNAIAAVEFKIVTTKGYVVFTAADNWAVLNMQTKLPVASTVFQIPNSTDEGTQESTNLIIQLFEHGSDKESSVFNVPVRQYGASVPVAETFGDWQVFRQEAKQDKITYSIWDARRRTVADVSVAVKLAWPHLPSNPNGYAENMDATFLRFLKSIGGDFGKPPKKEGEVWRRPTADSASSDAIDGPGSVSTSK